MPLLIRMGLGGAGGNEDHKKVKLIHNESQLKKEFKDAGSKLVVIDFSATW